MGCCFNFYDFFCQNFCQILICSHFMFSLRFMLFPTFLEKKFWGGGIFFVTKTLLSHFMFAVRFMQFFYEFLKD